MSEGQGFSRYSLLSTHYSQEVVSKVISEGHGFSRAANSLNFSAASAAEATDLRLRKLIVKQVLLSTRYSLLITFLPRYSPAMPNVYGVQLTSPKPAARMRLSISSGDGKRATDAGKYA